MPTMTPPLLFHYLSTPPLPPPAPAVFCLGGGVGVGVGEVDVGALSHWDDDTLQMTLAERREMCQLSAGLKPLHFITAQCFTALYVTRQ